MTEAKHLSDYKGPVVRKIALICERHDEHLIKPPENVD